MPLSLGNYNTSGTRTHVGFQFTTHDAAGANVAPSSAFEAADLSIYKATDGAAFSATKRSSANGITMTSPFNSLTGVHDVDIDLTDNTDAGFYAVSCRYMVILTPDETVDTQALTGVVLAYFEIGPVQADVRQWIGTAAATPTTAGVPEVDVTFWLGTAAATPTTAGVPEVDVTYWRGQAVPATTQTGVPEVDVTHVSGAAVSAGVVDVNIVQISGDSTAADNAELFFDGTGYAGTNNVIPTVTTLTGHTAQTGDVYAALTGANSEPTGVPAANATILQKIAYLFMGWRNRVDVTSSKITFYDDGGAAEFEKDLTDDDTTYSESEINAI
jgi:hypothetical protein